MKSKHFNNGDIIRVLVCGACDTDSKYSSNTFTYKIIKVINDRHLICKRLFGNKIIVHLSLNNDEYKVMDRDEYIIDDCLWKNTKQQLL